MSDVTVNLVARAREIKFHPTNFLFTLLSVSVMPSGLLRKGQVAIVPVIRRFSKSLFPVLLLFGSLALSPDKVFASPGESPFVISAESSRLDRFDVYVDRDHAITIDEATDPGMTSAFRPSSETGANLGFTQSSVWVRARLQNNYPSAQGFFIFLYDIPPTYKVDFYLPDNSGAYRKIAGGAGVPLAARAVDARSHAFRFRLPVGDQETYYINIEAETALILDFKILTPDAHHHKYLQEMDLLFLVTGIYLAICLYNLMLFISIRDRNYLYLMLFVLSFAFFLGTNFGIAQPYLWPNNALLGRIASPLFGSIAVFWGTLCTERFLVISRYLPSLNRLFKILLISELVLIALTFVYSFLVNILIGIFCAVVLVVAIYSTFEVLKKGYAPAKYFRIAILFALVGGLFFLLMIYGFLGMNFLTFGLGPISFIIAAILLTLSLGEEIRLLKDNYVQVFDAVREAILIYNVQEHAFTDCNLSAREMFGIPEFPILFHTETGHPDIVGPYQGIDPHQINLANEKGLIRTESRCINGKNELFWADITYKRTKINNIASILITVRNINQSKLAQEEKEKLEKRLFQSEKIEALGVLAGGVAHDFNNLLTSILGHANLINKEQPSGEIGEAATVIEKSAGKAAALTAGLLGFARKGKNRISSIDIHRLIRDATDITDKIASGRIALVLQLKTDRFTVDGDEAQIGQVFSNLISNAVDFMEEGGSLIITTEVVREADRELHGDADLEPGEYLHIAISDTGCGISKENLRKIFDPFFTTRPPGAGTGMGLPMAYGIIINHYGGIAVTSEKGQGTTFDLYLPLAGETAKRTVAPDVEIVSAAEETATATIMVVDDDDAVRKVAVKILNRAGYQTVAFANAHSAIDYYAENHHQIGLAILDMIMPGISGDQCFAEMKKINPELKVIIISGFAEQGILQQFSLEEICAIVRKPFKIDDLITTVSRALHP